MAWSVRDSAETYGIAHWGGRYFRINDAGEVEVRPGGADGPSVSLPTLVRDLRRRGLHTPVLLRFSGILASRIEQIHGCFERAISEYEYKGRYRPVYPIKVNQQRPVVGELIERGRHTGLGLEVGSKPELLVALALLDRPQALIVCNGYKDRAYLEMALLSQRLGRTTIVVIDRPHELDTLIKVSRELGIRPRMGVRARLAARGAGKWAESTGNRSKFGLSASEIVEVVERLRGEDMLDCLQLLHFHIGSQITAIRAHKDALSEASRIFTGLRELGAPLTCLDVGGGLGVDYDGSQSNFHSSMNYTTQEYAYDVVAAISEACDEAGIPHPDIVTESGRALVSHASVLVFDVLGSDSSGRQEPSAPAPEEHKVVRELREVLAGVNRRNVQESWHDALQLKDDAMAAFNLGYLDLRARATVEELFRLCCQRIAKVSATLSHVPEDLQDLDREICDTYYGNFSVFQSLPDSWAMEQLFPVMPIHRLDEEPTRRGTLADLTCDSDGKIDQFIDLRDVKRTLELHPLDGRDYWLGVFLLGAYQETLGELHNLFGDTDTVHIEVFDDGTYSIGEMVEGDTVRDVLSYLQYDARELSEKVRRSVEDSLRRGEMTIEESALLRRRYGQGLAGYTYLEAEED